VALDIWTTYKDGFGEYWGLDEVKELVSDSHRIERVLSLGRDLEEGKCHDYWAHG
jgi:hypothetical protein